MSKKLTTEEFIFKAKFVHKDKYDYSLTTYDGAFKKVVIKCNLCKNLFKQIANSHISGAGCSICYGNKKSNKEEFVRKAIKIEEFRNYNYEHFEYKNSDTKSKIICPKHGEFLKTPYKHINLKQGCPECTKEKLRNMFIKTKEDFVEMALLVKEHIDKNYKYDSFEYLGYKIKGNIFCPKYGHGFFKQTPNHHLEGVGCPKCKSSKGESEIRNFLKRRSIKFIEQKTFKDCINKQTNKSLKFDFYLPEYNFCIEYDGEQHFKPIEYFGGKEHMLKLQKRDRTKTQYCKKNNIKLIRIKFNESIEYVLKTFI